MGDVFEIFLQREGTPGYLELHVTPNNQKLQYKFLQPGMIQEPLVLAEEHFFCSHTWIERSENRWYVLAQVPGEALSSPKGTLPSERWNFSFSRYDYTRGTDNPVLSSSSPHMVPHFHRHHEWRQLLFTEDIIAKDLRLPNPKLGGLFSQRDLSCD